MAGERSAPAWNATSWAATSRSHPSTSAACTHQRRQPALVGQGAHHHHVIDRLAVHDDVGDPQVDVRRQPAIQLDLAPAVRLPDRTVGEVEKIEMDRLAKLVDPVTDEDED